MEKSAALTLLMHFLGNFSSRSQHTTFTVKCHAELLCTYFIQVETSLPRRGHIRLRKPTKLTRLRRPLRSYEHSIIAGGGEYLVKLPAH